MRFCKVVSAGVIATALLSANFTLALAQTNNESDGESISAATTPDYLINPGDILAISVWREEDLQREVLVRPDGKFSFPLAGDIDTTNKSIDEIRQQLKSELSKYIPELVVSVAVIQINGNKIYVIGQVNQPGDFVINPMVDVLQALSLAGGTTAFAEVNDIKILRRENGAQRSIEFRYRDVEKGKNLNQNIMLKAGDVIVVP
ncbi:MAG: polysaccharide biosynthesis/export family protein [Pseudomonadota bacterium]|nr:polysaccharide biosynthesis/export family protein [Pseudomonadota bacterium]